MDSLCNSWEFAASLDFDWLFISGKKRFQWPMVRVSGSRYSKG